jgi:hypothetical protein
VNFAIINAVNELFKKKVTTSGSTPHFMSCISLSGSFVCRELESQSILTFGNVTDLGAFQDYIIGADSVTNQCTSSIRFRESTLCYWAVARSSSCTLTKAESPLCRNTCQKYLTSLKAADKCDPKAVASSNTTELEAFCSTLPTTNCSPGVGGDLLRCGFLSNVEEIKYCKSIQNQDSCCQKDPNISPVLGLRSLAFIFLAIGVLLAIGTALLCYYTSPFVGKRSRADEEEAGNDSPIDQVGNDSKADGSNDQKDTITAKCE